MIFHAKVGNGGIIVDIKTEDAYKDISETKYVYDFFDDPRDHQFYDETSKES